MSSTAWSLAAVGISASQLVVLFVALWRTSMRITHAVAGLGLRHRAGVGQPVRGQVRQPADAARRDCLENLAAEVKRLTEHVEQQQRTGARPATAAAPVADTDVVEVAPIP